jgi:flagellar protein FlbD
LNGNTFVVNPDLLERAEATPDTVVTFVDGSRIVVLESIEELTELIVGFRARVAARAHVLLDETGSPLPHSDAELSPQGARVVPMHLREA